jgi:hypothetical protein
MIDSLQEIRLSRLRLQRVDQKWNVCTTSNDFSAVLAWLCLETQFHDEANELVPPY